MKKQRILIAEDDAHIREGLIDTLESEGYEVEAAEDGAQALTLHADGAYDLILLDVMMPEKSGYDVCQEIRKSDAQTPIIMLTAKSEEMDKVVGLKLGADDYVTKPFGVSELLARVQAVLRRTQNHKVEKETSSLPDVFLFGKAEVNCKELRVKNGKKTHDLSSRELKLIELFYNHPGEALSRDDLLNTAWGVDYYGTTRTLDQHIAQLRKKVEPGKEPSVITTVHGTGYRFNG